MLTRPTIRKVEFDPGDYGLEDEQVTWLRKSLGEKPTLDDLFELGEKRSLNDNQRRIVDGLKRSVLGQLRTGGGTAFSKDGKETVEGRKIWTLRGARVPSAARTDADKFAEDIKPHLIGQHGMLENLELFRRAYNSAMRRVPPMMVMGGDAGHGKDQALEGLAIALCGEHAKVIPIDLSTASDARLEELFGEGGKSAELSTWGLQDVEDFKQGIIHITGLEKLKDRAPGIAQELVKRLGTQRGENGHAWVPFVLDFDAPPGSDLRQLLEEALGPAAVRLRAAETEAVHLDENAMLEYMDVLLPQIFDQPGLGKLRLEIDPDAREVLGKALATPFEPLHELEQRLHTLIFSQFDAHDSVAADAVMCVHLMPELRDDQILQDRRVGAFKKKDANVLKLPQLFTVDEEGRLPDPDAHVQLLDSADEAVDGLLQGLNEYSARADRGAPEYGWTDRLLATLSTVEDKLRGTAKGLRDPGAKLFSAAEGAELLAVVKTAEDLLAEIMAGGAARLELLGLALDTPSVRALRAALDAARLIARAPELNRGQRPKAEEIKQLAAHVGDASQTTRALRQRLEDANRNVLDGSFLVGLNELSKVVQDALVQAKKADAEGMDPLLPERDAKQLVRLISVVKTMVDPPTDPKLGKPPPSVASVLLDAARKKKLLALLDKTSLLAEGLGGLSKSYRKTIKEARAEESKDTYPRRRAVARKLIRTLQGATEIDAAVVSAELTRLPLRVLKRLEKNGIPVTVIRGKITDYKKDMPKGERPPGYPEGTTYDDVPAVYVSGGKKGKDEGVGEVIIVTKEEKGNAIIPGLDSTRGHNSVVHEVMHAFDHGGFFSENDPGFTAAREADYAALDAYEKQPKEGGQDRGARETFAITGEKLYGGDETVRAKRPRLAAYLDEVTRDPDLEKTP